MNSIKQNSKYKNFYNISMKMTPKRLNNIRKSYAKKKDTTPILEIPRVKIDKDLFKKEDSFSWLGHSTILSNIDNISFIVDPMLGHRASPLKFVGPKRFKGSLTPIEELPKIDIVLITHNHYDHLDKGTILTLSTRVEKFFVPLDNARKLIKWGIKKDSIVEFDWFEEKIYKNLKFVFCPTQHFSGRTLADRDKALWGSWAVFGNEHSIYISGDSGYNKHFEQIGEKLGGFSVACMECGAYNENWSEVHMIPEESISASLDIKAKIMLPMHWAGFDLSTHPWYEPIKRATKEAKKQNVILTTPKIGQILSFKNPIANNHWWDEIK